MSEATVIDDPRPELNFDFAPGWPEELKDRARTLFAFDLDELRGRDRLGSLSFESAPSIVEAIRGLFGDVAQEPWDDLPATLTDEQLLRQLDELNNVLQEMLGLSADRDNAAGEKGSLESRLHQVREWFRTMVSPYTVNARVQRQLEQMALTDGEGTALEERNRQASELEDRIAKLVRDVQSQEDLVSSLRTAAGTSAGEDLSAVFQARADGLAKGIQRWFWALVASLVGGAAIAVAVFVVVRPHEGQRDAAAFGRLGLGLFILGLVVFGIRICAQNYRVNRHLQAVALSKAAALSTFTRFTSSVEEQEIRSTVALALAQSIFAVEDTGLVESSSDHVTLVERALAPRVSGSAPTS